jgi:hypothetical protein
LTSSASRLAFHSSSDTTAVGMVIGLLLVGLEQTAVGRRHQRYTKPNG